MVADDEDDDGAIGGQAAKWASRLHSGIMGIYSADGGASLRALSMSNVTGIPAESPHQALLRPCRPGHGQGSNWTLSSSTS